MSKRAVPPPTDLQERGTAFWQAVAPGRIYGLNVDEMQLLVEACRALDDLDAMRAQVQARGVTVRGSQGQTVAHPLLAQITATRQVLSRLLAQLGLPDPEGAKIPTGAQMRGRAAATARWRDHVPDSEEEPSGATA